MAEQYVRTLEILVAGDPGNGKANFIKRFLEYFPAAAEARRKNVTVHFLYEPDVGLKIHLYDVNNVESVDRGAYGKMDVVLFYYVANDSESFQSLEKWIGLMEADVKKQEMHSSSPRTKKEVSFILVADSSNVGSQPDVAEFIAEKAEKLKDSYGIKLFIQSSFENKESASGAFQIIMREVFPQKLDEESLSDSVESCEKSPVGSPTNMLPRGSSKKNVGGFSILSPYNCSDGYSEALQKLKFRFEELLV